jgi:hypothetical protein
MDGGKRGEMAWKTFAQESGTDILSRLERLYFQSATMMSTRNGLKADACRCIDSLWASFSDVVYEHSVEVAPGRLVYTH